MTALRDDLARAWARTDYHEAIADAISSAIPDIQCLFALWTGEAMRTLEVPSCALGVAMASTDWVRSGAMLRLRPFDPLKPDPLANQVLTDARMRRVNAQHFGMYDALALVPLHVGTFLRVTLYDRHRFLAFFSCFRPRRARRFAADERRMLAEIVPAVVDGMAARRRFQGAALRAASLAAVIDTITEPAFLVDDGGTVLYVNDPARRAFPTYPAWLAAAGGAPTPPWIRSVPIMADDGRFRLVLVKVLDVDYDSAASAPWCARWGLPPRLARVAAGLLRGRSDKDIAVDLGLEPSTVRTYVRHILARARVHGRAEFMAATFRLFA